MLLVENELSAGDISSVEDAKAVSVDNRKILSVKDKEALSVENTKALSVARDIISEVIESSALKETVLLAVASLDDLADLVEKSDSDG